MKINTIAYLQWPILLTWINLPAMISNRMPSKVHPHESMVIYYLRYITDVNGVSDDRVPLDLIMCVTVSARLH